MSYLQMASLQKSKIEIEEKSMQEIHHIRKTLFPKRSSDLATFVATHLSYEGQLTLLNRCLQSLLNQTKKTDIIVSISFSTKKYKKSFENQILKKYLTQIKFILASKQKSQMQHVNRCRLWIKNRKYKLITFLDDDDAYHPTRIQTFSENYDLTISEFQNSNKEIAGVKEFTSIKGQTEQQTLTQHNPEFWAYGVKPGILDLFFERMKGSMYLLKYNYADMYLRHFLARLSRDLYAWSTIETKMFVLYQYNNNNINSICGKLEAQTKLKNQHKLSMRGVMEYIRDQMLIATITMNHAHYKEYADGLKQTYYWSDESILKNVIPERTKILQLIEKLYDEKHLFVFKKCYR
eukprot:261514_1